MAGSSETARLEAWRVLSRHYIHTNSRIKIHLRSKYKFNINDIYTPLTIIENPLANMRISLPSNPTYANSILDRDREQIFPLEDLILRKQSQLYLAIGHIGTGKTWLARNITSIWANDLFNEGKSLLIYVDCELPDVKSAKDILTIISSFSNRSNFINYFEYLLSQDGENIIFIIDAYDVLLRYVPNNPLHQIVGRKLLSKSSILILSRPCLHFYNEIKTTYAGYTQLEVLGFSSKNCAEYYTKSSTKLLQGSQSISTFLSMFPDLRHLARFPLIAFFIIKLLTIENTEYSLSVDYIMKYIIVQIINQQLSHYLTGDIKSQYLHIVSLNLVATWKYQSLCQLYESAYNTLLDSISTVSEDIPTFHEQFSPDGLGLYCTTYTLVNNEWKPQFTFLSLIVQEYLASMYTKGDGKKRKSGSFDSILPFLKKDLPPHYFILSCSKDLLLNESDKDVYRFLLPSIHTSSRTYALLLNILVEIVFVKTEIISALFPDNSIQLSDYPMEGWLLRGVSFLLQRYNLFTSLTLTNCSITDKIIYLLLTNLHLNSTIQFINLQNNKLTDSSIPIIQDAFQSRLSSLRKIDLSNNSISTTQIISLESLFPQIEFISNQTIPQEILNRGEDFVAQYQLACNEGSQHIKFFRLMVVGSEGVGKTSLLKALRNKPFEEKETSTNFIEKTDITITELSNDWSQNLSFKERLKETRDDILAHLTVTRVKSLTNLSNLAEDTSFSDLVMQTDTTDNEELTLPDINIDTSIFEPELEPSEVTPINDPLLGAKQEFVIAQPPVEPIEQLREDTRDEQMPDLPTILLDPELSDATTENTADPPIPASFAQLANLPLKSIQDHWSNQRALLPIEFFTVWDLAGQSYFFCMHSLFLTPRAVYILPVDLSVDLQEPVAQRERETGRLDRREIKGRVTHLDVIQYWIMTIYSVAKSTAAEVYECKSRIIIVFTKADLVENSIERAAYNFQLITSSLSRKSNCLSIVDRNYHIVSSKDRSLEAFGSLRKSIDSNADEIGFNHALPVRWLDFALSILSSTNPVLGKAEITKIADSTRCSQDYTEILQLFHSIGVFFFRKNILVKSLQNLLDIIFHVVSPMNCLNLIQSMPKIAKSKSKQSTFRQDIEKAQSMAILTDNMLYAILEKNNLTEVKAEIAQLLEEFGVLLFKHGHGKHKEYFIPYLFKEDISAIYQPDPTDQIIYLYFPDYQIPTSFYFALLSLCLHQCNEFSHKHKRMEKNDPKLAFDCVKFQWEADLHCIIDFTEHQPYIRVIFQDIEYSDLNIRYKMFSLLFTLQKWIILIQRDLILSGKLAKIVLNCPCNSFCRTLKPCVYFETFLKQSGNESHFYCKVKQTYFAWRFFNKLLPFKQIPPEFGRSFIDEHREHIVENLELNLMLEALFEEGLINGEELSQIYILEKKDKVGMLLNNLPNKGKDWADKFYKVLKYDNHDIRCLFKCYIVETLFAEVPVGEDLDFGRYPILNNPCGICLIIHNENFDDNSKRRGSHIDFLNLKQTFENMNFLIYSYEDLSKVEMRKYITEIRSMDHSSFDTFFCIVMSHGDEEECIVTRDMKTIKKETILNSFTADACPSLAGKPKVFIFQACRGHRHDQGLDMLVDANADTPLQDNLLIQTDDLFAVQSSVKHFGDESTPQVRPQQEVKKVANFADFYIAQATVKGYVSYRYVTKGSVFISALCSVLKSARYHHHLVDMMIEVRRQVSMVDVKNNVQCPEATDTFTKQLYLF